MRLTEMIGCMKATRRRKLVGDIVGDEIAREGRTRKWAALTMHMSESQLYRILNGDVEESSLKWNSVEKVLTFPDGLLTHILDGDTQSIEAIPEVELRPALRRRIVRELTEIDAEGVEDGEDNHQAR